MSNHTESLRETLLQALETGSQPAAGEQTADDPAAEFARFIGEGLTKEN
jgi:hypothetical protein